MLLLTAVASFVLPLCVITTHKTVVMPMPMIDVELGAAVIEEDVPNVPFWQMALPILYIIGMDRLRDRDLFISMEPHLDVAGQFGGFTAPDKYVAAVSSVRAILDRLGIKWS